MGTRSANMLLPLFVLGAMVMMIIGSNIANVLLILGLAV